MKCAICGDSVIEDEAVEGLNPLTFRRATMHSFCFSVGFEDLKGEQASKVDFTDRQDEYLTRIQNRGIS